MSAVHLDGKSSEDGRGYPSEHNQSVFQMLRDAMTARISQIADPTRCSLPNPVFAVMTSRNRLPSFIDR